MSNIRLKALVIVAAVSVFATASSGADVLLKVPAKYRKGEFKKGLILNAPPGFKVSVFAAGLDGPRFMATDARGVIYVSLPSKGEVIALPDSDGDGVADMEVVFAEGLDRPHGLGVRDGGLIVAETGRLLFLKDADNDLKADTKELLSDDIPSGGGHWTRSVVAGPDGSYYVSVGSSCNVCIEDDKRRAAVLKIKGKKSQIYASGLRNSVGIALHPGTEELWGVDNGRDLLGDDLPPEELNRIVSGGDYGWPYCYGDKTPDPEHGRLVGGTERCASTIAPVVKMQAHSAPLGIAFAHGLKFPREFSGGLFIAFHGSWNRTVKTGYKLVYVPFRGGKPSGPPKDFITGWLKDDDVLGRPVTPLVGKDGALYLSDDYAGAVYRIEAE